MAKTGYKPDGTKVVDPFDTPEKKIAEIRNMRAGKLFVSRMDFVDALLKEYDTVCLQLDGAKWKLKQEAQSKEMSAGAAIATGFLEAAKESEDFSPSEELQANLEPIPGPEVEPHHELVDLGESGA